MSEKKNTFWEKLREPIHISASDPQSFMEKWGLNINRLQMFSGILLFSIIIGFITYLLLSYTPLSYTLPKGVSDTNRSEIVENEARLNALIEKMEQQENYNRSLRRAILGEIPVDSVLLVQSDTVDPNTQSIDTARTLNQLRIAEEVESDRLEYLDAPTSGNTFFINPLKGIVSEKFNKKTHPGVDVIAQEGSPIFACLGGIVIYSGNTFEDGNMIIISHHNNILSIYKHNSTLLKKVGDQIEAGDGIAIIGNSGENSTGSHLHFELWENNSPVNPTDYLSFQD